MRALSLILLLLWIPAGNDLLRAPRRRPAAAHHVVSSGEPKLAGGRSHGMKRCVEVLVLIVLVAGMAMMAAEEEVPGVGRGHRGYISDPGRVAELDLEAAMAALREVVPEGEVPDRLVTVVFWQPMQWGVEDTGYVGGYWLDRESLVLTTYGEVYRAPWDRFDPVALDAVLRTRFDGHGEHAVPLLPPGDDGPVWRDRVDSPGPLQVVHYIAGWNGCCDLGWGEAYVDGDGRVRKAFETRAGEVEFVQP